MATSPQSARAEAVPAEDSLVLVRRDMLASACAAIRLKKDAPKTIEYLRSVMFALAPASGRVDAVAVKALEWRAIERARLDEDPSTEETGDYEATSPFGEYFIECGFGSDSYVWSVSFCGDFVIDKDDPEAAKAAVQADYEQRIRSALSPAATSGSEAGGEAVALRKSLAEVLAFARALEKHSGKGTGGRRGGAIFARAEAALATPAHSAKEGQE